MVKAIKVNLVFLLLLSSFMLGGCATKAHFSNTPVNNAEFTKSMTVLEHDYSDIKEYDRFFASPSEAPTLQELEELWGKSTTEKRWGVYALNIALGAGLVATGVLTYPFLAAIFVLNPTPPEEYVWKKGNYEIVATGRNDALVGYEKRIHSWEWEEFQKDEELSKLEPIKNPQAAF